MERSPGEIEPKKGQETTTWLIYGDDRRIPSEDGKKHKP
jgi:hypothetical protein